MSSAGLRPGFSRPDLEDVPHGWRLVQLGDVANITGGGRLGLTKTNSYRSSGFPAYSAAGQDGFVDRWEFDCDAVVVPSIGSIGRGYRAEGRWTTLANTQVIRPEGTKLSHRFLHWRVDDTAFFPVSGTAQPFIKPSDFPKCWLSLPPLIEQAHIAAVLDTLDTSIRQTEVIIAKLTQVKQGLLHDLLTRGIDANGELRQPQNEAPHLYKQSPIGLVPCTWDVLPIAAIADVRSGSTPLRAAGSRYFCAEGFPWVKTLDLNEGVINATNESISDAALRESSCALFPIGTVLVAMYGGWEQIGRTAILGCSAATNQAISALLPKSDRILSEFLLRALQFGRPRWAKVAASTRKDPNITKSDVDRFEVALPSSSEEQALIVLRFRAILDRLSAENATLKKLRSGKLGLMDDLLTGRVRVTSLLQVEVAAV